MSDGETCNSEMVDTVTTAVQESGAVQIHQETVHRADRQLGQAGDLLGSETTRRFAEKMQKTQAALQRGDVVASFFGISHELLQASVDPSQK